MEWLLPISAAVQFAGLASLLATALYWRHRARHERSHQYQASAVRCVTCDMFDGECTSVLMICSGCGLAQTPLLVGHYSLEEVQNLAAVPGDFAEFMRKLGAKS